jgi:hypothetical protein
MWVHYGAMVAQTKVCRLKKKVAVGGYCVGSSNGECGDE